MDIGDFSDSAYWQEPDFLLSDLVSLMANKMGAQLGITLMIKGSVITGTMVGEREYLDAINRLFKTMARESLPKPSKEDIAALEDTFHFDTLTEDNYPDDDGEWEDEEEAFETPPIRYLHLREPMIVYPGSTVSFTDSALPIMRIRLNTIDGWMMGRVTIIGSDDMTTPGMIH